MTILFGTLGFTPEKFTPTIRSRDDVERVVLFYDKHERSREARQKVTQFCHELGIDVEGVEVDAFDLVEAAVPIRQKMQQYDRTSILFNVTGGTKVLASAAMLACILEGVRAIYLHDTTGDEVALPLLTIQYEDHLSSQVKKVLAYIHQNPGCSPTDVGGAVDLAKPTITHHVKRLADYGLIEKKAHENDQRKATLWAIPSVKLLLGLENEDPRRHR